MVDPITNMPIVILREHEGDIVLPIWVGVFEANAIAIQIENVETPRPMTHDLIRNMLADLDARVEKIVISNWLLNVCSKLNDLFMLEEAPEWETIPLEE